MATFDRTGPLRLEPQLDSSATEAFDCGVAACVMALDDASYGLIRPSTGAVRKRMRNLREATNPDQWKVAIDAVTGDRVGASLERFRRARFTAVSQRAVQPPSTMSVVPVTSAAAGDAR